MPVASVGTAEEGLELLERRNAAGRRDPFGLVVLDWMLPGMNGLDAAARIRRARADARPADHPDQRLRRQGGGGPLRGDRRQRVPAQADHRLVALRRDRRGGGARRTRCAGARDVAARARVRAACGPCWPRTTRPTRWSPWSCCPGWASSWTSPPTAARRSRWCAPTPALRGHPHGHADAGDGRPRGDARDLRADPPFGELPIIAMTANAMKQRPRRLPRGGHERPRHQADRSRGLLAATLRRWLPASSRLAPGDSATESASPTEVLSPTDVPSPSPRSKASTSPAPSPVSASGSMRCAAPFDSRTARRAR